MEALPYIHLPKTADHVDNIIHVHALSSHVSSTETSYSHTAASKVNNSINSVPWASVVNFGTLTNKSNSNDVDIELPITYLFKYILAWNLTHKLHFIICMCKI